jgi:hypothetical protein
MVEHRCWRGHLLVPSVEFMVTTPEPATTDAATAAEILRDALTAAGIVLPSLGTEKASPSLNLVTMGRVRADVALRLADVVRRGCA